MGVSACSNCTSGHRMGMSIQRCSSPWHGAIKLHCQSSRGIQKCFVLSSQVFDATYLSFSNKDMYCKETLYKYSHGLLSMARATATSFIQTLRKYHHRQSCANYILYTNRADRHTLSLEESPFTPLNANNGRYTSWHSILTQGWGLVCGLFGVEGARFLAASEMPRPCWKNVEQAQGKPPSFKK